MGGQDLLEQGGARARQAEDEDRIGPRVAPAGAALEEIRVQTSICLRVLVSMISGR